MKKKLNKGGRPTVYKDQYAEELIKFFDIEPYSYITIKDAKGNDKMEMIPAKFPTLARFAAKIGVTRETLHDWATSKLEDGSIKNPEFSYAYKLAKEFQEAILVEGSMANAFNASFSIFTAKNVLGWRDKIEQELSGKDGTPFPAIQVMFVNPEGNNINS